MSSGREQPDAGALHAAIVARETSVSEVVESALVAARASSESGAFLELEEESARELASARDTALEQGVEPGPLFGVPVALKANLCRVGSVTSCNSRVLEGWSAPYDATVVSRLLEAGAVPIGVTHMDEFAMGSSGENSPGPPARNPFDPTRTPGGSSSGSAVSVAARTVPLALGSDTGGSVRQPASFCGVYGFKPTWGRVSRYGLVAFGSSLDQVSPFARSARDLGAVLEVISGPDERDSTCLDAPPIRARAVDLGGLSIGVPTQLMPSGGGLDDEVRASVEAALELLRRQGAELREVSLPSVEQAIATYYVIAAAEASSNLARYDGVRYGQRVAPTDGGLAEMIAASRARFGEEVKRRILLGTFVLSAGYSDEWYRRASRVRRVLVREFAAAFEGCDLIAGPTAPTPAFRLGELEGDPLAMYQSDICTVPVSLAGLPAVSVPCGSTRSDLPIGLQLIAPAMQDEQLLGAVHAWEQLYGPPSVPRAGGEAVRT